MPWCEGCTRFFTPPSVLPGGECPSCGRVIAQPARAPWHFKVLVGTAGVYLAWRAVQGVDWVLTHLG